jgi:hypothetical protein
MEATVKKQVQQSIDLIQREATKLNALGFDVAITFDNMRDINRALPLEKNYETNRISAYIF